MTDHSLPTGARSSQLLLRAGPISPRHDQDLGREVGPWLRGIFAKPRGVSAAALAAVSADSGTTWDIYEHYGYIGDSRQVDLLENGASPLRAWRR